MPNRQHELIPIQTRDETEQWVDARTLHIFVESKQEFANWVKPFLQDYGFLEGRDFLTILSKSTGGRQAIEFTITLDMAKHIAMLQRSEKGMQARQYFIEAEKKLRQLEKGAGMGRQKQIAYMQQLSQIPVKQQDGSTWFEVASLLAMAGIPRQGSVHKRIKRMENTGCTRKFEQDGKLYFYVKKECVQDLFGLRIHETRAVEIVQTINAGGAL